MAAYSHPEGQVQASVPSKMGCTLVLGKNGVCVCVCVLGWWCNFKVKLLHTPRLLSKNGFVTMVICQRSYGDWPWRLC